jgi:hypothetical protein
MKHRKHVLNASVLLALFVCVSAAPIYADSPPDWLKQRIGVGG